MTETPFHLQLKRNLDGASIEFREVMELCQGGPEVGNLFINERQIAPKSRFGGPILKNSAFIYVPIFCKSIFNSGFKIAQINIDSGEYKLRSKLFPLIHLLNLDDNVLTFATDAKCSEIYKINI